VEKFVGDRATVGNKAGGLGIRLFAAASRFLLLFVHELLGLFTLTILRHPKRILEQQLRALTTPAFLEI
jgi:hypothetical protein